MKLDAILLQIAAAVFIVYGGAFVYAPEWIGMIVTDSLPSTPHGMIDYRATYGGLQVGVGLFFAVMSMRRATVRTGMVGLFLLMVCMAGARYYGVMVDGEPGNMMLGFVALEVVTAALAVILILADMLDARRKRRLAPSVEPETSSAEKKVVESTEPAPAPDTAVRNDDTAPRLQRV